MTVVSTLLNDDYKKITATFSGGRLSFCEEFLEYILTTGGKKFIINYTRGKTTSYGCLPLCSISYDKNNRHLGQIGRLFLFKNNDY